MSRALTLIVATVAIVLSASPAFAQRFRIPSARPTVSKPVETTSSSSSSRSYGGYYSSSSSSTSSDDSRDSGVTFHLVCLVIILLSLAVRIIAGVIGFFVWVGRRASG